MFFIQDNGNVLLWFFAKRSPLKSKDIPIFGSEGYNHTRMVTHQRWELIGNIPISKFKKFWTEIYIVPRDPRNILFNKNLTTGCSSSISLNFFSPSNVLNTGFLNSKSGSGVLYAPLYGVPLLPSLYLSITYS